ncbi:hypothetical protein I7I51_03595 [Histoplasma capsulatum]|uniref:Uncharacterized protein n=1 Tax=Ajellomyces capsulatus TaxID=5037 RepID=A0A8A1M826_AJECA|nr:hypothetical protein I7I51_03595 [Histoplasma capsulatum]
MVPERAWVNAVNVMLRQAGTKGWDKAGIPKKSLELHPWASNKHNRIKALQFMGQSNHPYTFLTSMHESMGREYARRDRILQVNYARTLENPTCLFFRRCMGELTVTRAHSDHGMARHGSIGLIACTIKTNI